MLSKRNRLNLSNKDNQVMFERGSSNFFSGQKLLFYERDNLEMSREERKELGLRVAALAPKRLFAKVTARTRARRQLYLALEEVLKDLERKQIIVGKSLHYDLILVLKARTFTQEDLHNDILNALKHYEII